MSVYMSVHAFIFPFSRESFHHVYYVSLSVGKIARLTGFKSSSRYVCSSISLSSCLSVRSPDRQFFRPSPSVCSTKLPSKCLFVCQSIQLPLAQERNFGNHMCTACQSPIIAQPSTCCVRVAVAMH